MKTKFFFGLLASTFAALFVFFVVHAATDEIGYCAGQSITGKKVIMVFVNGIRNTETDAKCSAGLLRSTLISHGVPKDSFDYMTIYNPTNGFVADVTELLFQATISANARAPVIQSPGTPIITVDFYKNLGDHYYRSIYIENLHLDEEKRKIYGPVKDLYERVTSLIASGKNVILVPHSQGNYFVEALYALMYREEIQKYGLDKINEVSPILSHLRVVGVAPVSSSTPYNNYVSIPQDGALDAHRSETSALANFSVLPSLNDACIAPCSFGGVWSRTSVQAVDGGTGHSFTSVYLNDYILDLYTSSTLGSLVASKVSAAMSSFPTVETPGSVIGIVSFKSQTGVYGVETVVFFDGLASDSTAETIIYNFGDGDSVQSKAEHPLYRVSHAFRAQGVYTVTLTLQKGGSSKSCSLPVTIGSITNVVMPITFTKCT